MPDTEARYFTSPAEFRKWLRANHAKATELLVGFYKRGTGHPTLTWPESVAEALCYGWIDGVRRRVDDERYTIRFTPRKPTSIWSAVNIALMEKLIAEGRAGPAGLQAFERRREAKSAIYAYEQRQTATLEPEMEREFRANRAAWRWFESAPAWYRRNTLWWIVSAKRPETRARRLAELIAASAEGRTIARLTRADVKGRGDGSA
jgi:uncharacterized protein YdeI (YjbR/CyaY-like superfamily)